MRKIAEIKSDRRIQIVKMGFDGMAGYVNSRQNRPPNEIAFIASWAGGWEHVSVSLRNRCPTWDEMCLVKDIFWRDDECVVQFHPPKNEYINVHPYCLHLWKKIGEKTDLPPKELIAITHTSDK